MTTKEQERAALAKIEKILATVDADGWIATAFQGCVEHARDNIENDFANSWYDAAQHEAKRVYELEKENAELRGAYDALKARKIETKTRDNIWNFISYELSTAKVDARNAAAEMLDACDNTESNEYKNALRKAQTAKRRAGRLQEMLDGLQGKDC